MRTKTSTSLLLTKREFYGESFYKWLVQQYEESRRYLKHCGRPKDDFDRYMIEFHRDTAHIYSRMLGN